MSRPWYYVPGRKDLTERRLHRKKEIDARRNETWAQINNYFNSCSMRCKMFNEWSKMQPASRVFTLPPYDGDFSNETKDVDAKKLQDAEIKLRNLIKELTRIEEDADHLKWSGNEIVTQMTLLKQTISDVNGTISSWTIKSKKIRFVRFTRDKLRHQVFMHFEKLSYFYALLSNICPSNIREKILTNEEGDEFNGVIDGAQNIIQTFIDLNRQRNYEIVNMFQEEADLSFDEYQKDWMNEDSICFQLILSIFDAVEVVLKEKLDQNISEQETLLVERTEKCHQLSSLITDLKSDEPLWIIISSRIQ